MAEKRSGQKLRIFGYGFDQAGFETPKEPVMLANNGQVEFIPFAGTASLDEADGVIIPQGIFEEIKTTRGYSTVQVFDSFLQERVRQVNNLLKEGKWICFLVGPIVDSVPDGGISKIINDTDLCKKILNSAGITEDYRERADGISLFTTKFDEFRSYMREYGVANTLFSLRDSARIHVLADVKSRTVAFDYMYHVFFLPFHTVNKNTSAAKSIVEKVSRAIFDYRQKRIVEIPAWVDEFQFEAEERLRSEISSLNERTRELNEHLQVWRDYKAILNASGDILKENIVSILRDFFGLKVNDIEEFREDAKIVDENGKVMAIIEARGTKRGVQRGDISQVDANRDRSSLPHTTPGVLFINTQMSVSGIDKRLNTTVAEEQIKHAQTLNVLIVRAIDLLFLMRHLESSSNRKEELMKIIGSGGGWLKATRDKYELVT